MREWQEYQVTPTDTGTKMAYQLNWPAIILLVIALAGLIAYYFNSKH